jgi:hypothetical protein
MSGKQKFASPRPFNQLSLSAISKSTYTYRFRVYATAIGRSARFLVVGVDLHVRTSSSSRRRRRHAVLGAWAHNTRYKYLLSSGDLTSLSPSTLQ